jgi:hypothetical protein
MQLFVLTLHCTSRAHCRVCRSLEGGRNWRQKIGSTYELPKAKPDALDPVDFECPYDVPWNSGAAQPQKSAKPSLAMQTPPPPAASNDGQQPVTAESMENRSKQAVQAAVMRESGSRGQRKGCGCSRNS